ncbi:MAG: hypothetical protein ACK4R7_00155 [Fervidobacterium sp.]
MSDFNVLFEQLSKILEPLAEKLNTKIWICEKIGKRFSCIARAGIENYCESYIVYEDEKYIVFAQRQLNEQEFPDIKQFITAVLYNKNS